MEYKYISDLHLYDVYSLDWRDKYVDLDTYAINLIDNWNTFTDSSEVVIIVGDIGHYCPRTVDVLKKLNGIKILVKGNHDELWGRHLYTCDCFKGIHDFIDTPEMFIEHIPKTNQSVRKYHIHGHHHRYDTPGMLNALRLYAADTYRINCAADLNNNRPCTIQELILNKEVMLDKFRESGLLTGGI